MCAMRTMHSIRKSIARNIRVEYARHMCRPRVETNNIHNTSTTSLELLSSTTVREKQITTKQP